MAQQIADRRDIDFVLYEQLMAQDLCKVPRYADFTKKAFDLLVNEARNFAIKEILPTFKEADVNGARFENGKVITPACYKKPYKVMVEGEWIAMTEDPEVGGQGFPATVAQAALEYIIGASFAFAAYGLAGHGTAKMIELFGTPKQKELFLKKLYSGNWTGTMVLTEPEAGSDVGNLSTTAVKNPDGTYSISGNKIFITNGEHDLAPNIIHPVLARIEGAPKGTKGISLFVVPKIWVNDDGSFGEENDVVCTAIEEKMGLHGSATCQLTFGGKGKCRGTLLGEENKGMRVMFHMMNEARLAVGAIGLCNASTAYLYALDYARNRKQGRDLMDFMNPDAPPVSIIRHPDVRRMLLWMKAMTEGMRSLVYFCANCFDRAETAEDEKERDLCKGLIEMLTPIIKSYCTDRGFEVCIQAIQIYGGYGYTQDYPVEQLARDSKINSIYEGTNGIQAMDLLGRKLGMKNGAYFMALLGEIDKAVKKARENAELGGLADKLDKAKNRLAEVAMGLGGIAMSPRVKTAFSFAFPFLEAMGDVIIAWMLLWRATVAAEALKPLLKGAAGDARAKIVAENKNASFYEGQIVSARYFISSMLPITLGRFDAIAAADDAVVDMPEAAFGG
ncbi:MAG: acyl-CoA dehydrogenase [Thermodesulfobacteriota bacterium]